MNASLPSAPRHLIADSGATKTTWLLLTDRGRQRFATQGINPYHQSPEAIARVLADELRPQLDELPTAIHFYGAGCNEAKQPLMRQLIQAQFPDAEVEVQSDLLGAARGLCGRQPGVVCILGTGTNSGRYDGRRLTHNTPPLGYILGDEGSGAAMGRDFVADILKGLAPQGIIDAFWRETQTTYADIIENVYRGATPSRYLAAFSRFVLAHADEAYVQAFLDRHFRRFFQRNLVQYACRDLPIHFIGGVAAAFEPWLRSAAQAEGYRIGTIGQEPIDGLAAYYQSPSTCG